VLFTPSFAPRREYEAAFARGVTVTLDNVEALQRWPELFRNRTLWLRLDLGHGEGHHEKVKTGGGRGEIRLADRAASMRSSPKRASSASASAACTRTWAAAIDDPRHWRGVYAELAGLADNVGTIETIDIGGGLPIPYTPDCAGIRPGGMARRARRNQVGVSALRPGDRTGPLPRRRSGVLLLRRPRSWRRTACAASAATRHERADAPAMYEAYHGIHNLSRLRRRERGVRRGRPDLRKRDVLGRVAAAARDREATCCWSPTPAPTAWRWPTPTTCGPLAGRETCSRRLTE
jgi:diaminopimelate decarboxylase/aspartate kinase